ncbi:MAG: uroporphyrinogen-III synthase [Xanthomonadales bacterium]|nr:uroporphyrinogen-III synthase [Gammaproteobacteria bacterium]NNL04074.1 uroporphyrinogen-III synthase [Xanthomonadales bacterium]
MKASHAFLTRPRDESTALAARIEPLGLEAVIQPAFRFVPVDAGAEQPEDTEALAGAGSRDLLLFTSPRAVEHGLPQVSRDALSRLRIAAIGPATARALARSGVRTSLQAASGYTSEDLLQTLGQELKQDSGGSAFILAAPRGRIALAEGLEKMGLAVRTLMVYRAEAEPLDREALSRLDSARDVLSVWTSANAMRALAQRLPPATWFRICQGEWLVISDRLARLARAYGPSDVHLATGPGNDALVSSIRNLT